MGRDRFDDPHGEYRVRYLATSLHGALLEVLDHFRSNDRAGAALDAMVGIEGIDILEEELPGKVPERWLAEQRVGRAHIDSASAVFIDVTNDDLLTELNNSARIQAALADPSVREAFGPDVRLDQGTIRAVGSAARTITQAVSREVFEIGTHVAGIRYKTRFSDKEECWAVFDDRVHVQFDEPTALDVTDPEVLMALSDVAGAYRLRLPSNWVL